MDALMLLTEKQDGTIKRPDVQQQKGNTWMGFQDYASSPTAYVESKIFTGVIETWRTVMSWQVMYQMH